jgi:tRNA A37 threonylcarbamoyltransferase TsaD
MATDEDSHESQKKLAFYTAAVEAWVATRMEKDKTLLALAAGGIGLLATLLTAVADVCRAVVALWLRRTVIPVHHCRRHLDSEPKRQAS